METVTIHAANTGLSRLLARVETGEEIVLARGKQPIAKLVPYRGIVSVSPEFFEPLPPDEPNLASPPERSPGSNATHDCFAQLARGPQSH